MHELVPGLFGRRIELQTHQNHCNSDIRLLSSRRSLRADDSSGGLGSTQALQEWLLFDCLLWPSRLLFSGIPIQNTGTIRILIGFRVIFFERNYAIMLKKNIYIEKYFNVKFIKWDVTNFLIEEWNFSIRIVINFRRFVVPIIISYSQLCHVSDFLLESSRRKVTGIASDGTITIQATERSFKYSNVENTTFFTVYDDYV